MPFRFRAEARVYKYLGEYDAFVQLEEVAIRRFVDAIKHSNAPREFVIGEAKLHNINVTVVPAEEFSAHAAQTYIVVAYQSADQFLSEFQIEHELLHGQIWPRKPDRESHFDHLIRCLGPSVAAVERAVGKLRIEVFDYYRLVRNLSTHRYDPDEDNRWGTSDATRGRERKRLDSKIKRIRERFADEIDGFRGKLAAPNEYGALTFDDFILATRNIKHIATALSRVAQPSDEQLIAALDAPARRYYRKEPHNLPRVRRRIAGAAQSRFGIERVHAEHVASLWSIPSGPVAQR